MFRTLPPASSPVPVPEPTSPQSYKTSTGCLLKNGSISKYSSPHTKHCTTWPPPYLSDLLEDYEPPRTLRSSDAGLLTVYKAKRRTWGDRAFSVAAPILWNELPKNIRDAPSLPAFKTALKTHLFKIAFPS